MPRWPSITFLWRRRKISIDSLICLLPSASPICSPTIRRGRGHADDHRPERDQREWGRGGSGRDAHFYYTPPVTNSNPTDQFTYTISDGRGGVARPRL